MYNEKEYGIEIEYNMENIEYFIIEVELLII